MFLRQRGLVPLAAFAELKLVHNRTRIVLI